MNILVVSNYQMFNNLSASFVFSQAVAYVRLGHRVRIIIPTAFGKRDCFGLLTWRSITLTQCDGVELVFIRFLSLSNFGEQSFNKKSAAFTVAHSLKKLLDGFSPDIIHAHALTTSIAVGICLKKQLGIPLVVTTHGSDVSIPMERDRGAELTPLCDRADTVVAVSSALAEKVRTCGTSTPISVILNGFDLRALPEAVWERGHTFIQVGSLQDQKRAHVTIRAFARLRERYPDARLTLVGSGPDRARQEAHIRELGISGAVRFLGTIPNREVLAEMSKARFFILPSVREGFGIVYLEAMACGCVTIGTEGEGIADLIVSGENGFLVPPDDPDAIVRTATWCLDHPEKASAIAEKGRRAARGLTWEENAERYINLFKELIS